MIRYAMLTFVALAVWLCLCGPAKSEQPLQIYFIDAEGGQSTLVVTPERHSLLIDTGWAGNASRIVAAARDAGIKQIDYLWITHFHNDHDGGAPELVQLMPVGTFVDHGTPNPEAVLQGEETRKAFDAYEKARGKAPHIEPRPGDRLPFHDVEALVVSAAGATLSAPLSKAGERNTACPDHAPPALDPLENPRSNGVLIRYGQFRFLDVGDLTGEPLYRLTCPRDLIGPVDAYLVAHHGGADVADPATFAAFKPRIAIMNNGLHKGGAPATFATLHHVSGLESVWQLHTSADAGDANFPAAYVANPDDSTTWWIKLVANRDGSFRVLNQRTGKWQDYGARRP